MASLEINLTHTDVFKRMAQLIQEVRELTNEPHVRDYIDDALNHIQEETDYGD